MAVRSTAVAVATTATSLITGADADSNPGSRDILITNTGTVTLYLGGPGVSTSSGTPLGVGAQLAFNDVNGYTLPYAVVASGTGTAVVLEAGV